MGFVFDEVRKKLLDFRVGFSSRFHTSINGIGMGAQRGGAEAKRIVYEYVSSLSYSLSTLMKNYKK